MGTETRLTGPRYIVTELEGFDSPDLVPKASGYKQAGPTSIGVYRTRDGQIVATEHGN